MTADNRLADARAAPATNESFLVQILTPRGFVMAAIVWGILAFIPAVLGWPASYSRDAFESLAASMLTFIVLPFGPAIHIFAGLFRPPAPFRTGALLGIATAVVMAVIVKIGTSNSYYSSSVALPVIIALLGVASMVIGGVSTAATVWVINKLRGTCDVSSSTGEHGLLGQIARSRGFVVGWVLWAVLFVLLVAPVLTAPDSLSPMGIVNGPLSVMLFGLVANIVAGLFRPLAPFRTGFVLAAATAGLGTALWMALIWLWGGFTFGNMAAIWPVIYLIPLTVVALIGSALTGVSAWITTKVRGPRQPTPPAPPIEWQPAATTVAQRPGASQVPPPQPTEEPTVEDRLAHLEQVRRLGYVTEHEYSQRRTEIISEA